MDGHACLFVSCVVVRSHYGRAGKRKNNSIGGESSMQDFLFLVVKRLRERCYSIVNILLGHDAVISRVCPPCKISGIDHFYRCVATGGIDRIAWYIARYTCGEGVCCDSCHAVVRWVACWYGDCCIRDNLDTISVSEEHVLRNKLI